MDHTDQLERIIKALDYSPLASAVLDSAELNIAFANQSMLKVWRETDRIFGKPFSEVFPSFKEEGFSAILERVWKTGVTYRASNAAAHICDGGLKHKRFFDFEYKALYCPEGSTYAILISAVDVSEKNRNIDAMKQLQEQLEFNRDLEQITHTISHDAKNPISIVKLGLDTLSKSTSLPEDKVSQWYALMKEALINLEHTIDDMVSLSEARSYKICKELIDVKSKIHAWVQKGRDENQPVTIEFNFGTLLPVFSDERGVSKVFIHIICNAIKYSKSEPDAFVKIFSTEEASGVAYYIEDNGVGIPQSRIDTIFSLHTDEVSSTGNSEKGLGMFLSKHIMDRLGAQITVSSKEHEWTSVRLFFPN